MTLAIKKEISSTEIFIITYLGFIVLVNYEIEIIFMVFVIVFLYYFYIKKNILKGKNIFKGKKENNSLNEQMHLVDEKILEYKENLKSKKTLNTVLIDRLYENIEADIEDIAIASNKNEEEYNSLINMCNRCEKSIEGVLKSTKLKFGAYSLNLEEANGNVLLKQAVTEYGEILEEKRLLIVEDLGNEGTVVLSDIKLLSEVFREIFNNIYEHAQEGTRVYFKAEKNDDEYVVNIKNISSKSLNKSYEEFIDGLSGTKGLSLSIIEESVKSMGGSFKVSIVGDLFDMTIGLKVVN